MYFCPNFRKRYDKENSENVDRNPFNFSDKTRVEVTLRIVSRRVTVCGQYSPKTDLQMS